MTLLRPRYILTFALLALACVALRYGANAFILGIIAVYVALLYCLSAVWIWAWSDEGITASHRAVRLATAVGCSLAMLYLTVIGLAE